MQKYQCIRGVKRTKQTGNNALEDVEQTMIYVALMGRAHLMDDLQAAMKQLLKLCDT